MRNITVDDKILTGGRSSELVIIAQGYGFARWNFESVNGAVVTSKKFTKQGKWSHFTYEVEVADGIHVMKLNTSWLKNFKTWGEVISKLRDMIEVQTATKNAGGIFSGYDKTNSIKLTDDQVKRGIKSIMPSFAKELDSNDEFPDIASQF